MSCAEQRPYTVDLGSIIRPRLSAGGSYTFFFPVGLPYSAVNFPLLNKLFMAFMPKIFGQKESKGVGPRLGEAKRNPRMKDDDGPTSEYASVRVS